MILGFSLDGPDNKSWMWEDHVTQDSCPNCGLWRLPEIVNPRFRLLVKKWDLSYTYDGFVIVSDRFRKVTESMEVDGCEFVTLPYEPKHFVLSVKPELEVDFIRRETVFGPICDICQRPFSVIGATPVCLKDGQAHMDGFFRTNLDFGDGNSASPVLIVGVNTYEKLIGVGLKGLDFREIQTRYDWEST